MFGETAAIGCARFGDTFPRRSVGLVLSLDGRDGRFQILQRKIELIGIGLLGFAPEGRLLEGGDQSFQLFDPLVLASFTCGCRDQHRFQGNNINHREDPRRSACAGSIKTGLDLPLEFATRVIVPQLLNSLRRSRFDGTNPTPVEARK
ncbi:hypothetical protein CO731_00710 [Aminobacter sp. MSH1]|nr:hypothetical protein CO731_00710 [Aminobacter sp. MSH1]